MENVLYVMGLFFLTEIKSSRIHFSVSFLGRKTKFLLVNSLMTELLGWLLSINRARIGFSHAKLYTSFNLITVILMNVYKIVYAQGSRAIITMWSV